MRNRNTVEFLGIWETLHNPNFNPLEFEGFRKEAGLNAFTLSPTRWIETTNAIGIVSQAGRYGGTFAQTDIAFEFPSARTTSSLQEQSAPDVSRRAIFFRNTIGRGLMWQSGKVAM